MTAGYLVFSLSGRVFGVLLEGALEIIPWRRSRPVPLAYSYVRGLIDYRGKLYPVFDLTQRLELKPSEPMGFVAEAPAPSTHGESILLLEVNKNPFGIEVDAVKGMAKIEEVAPPPAESRDVSVQFIKGICYDNNEEVVLLDFERLFFHGS